MPAPPTPTMWIDRRPREIERLHDRAAHDRHGIAARTGVLLDEVGEPRRRRRAVAIARAAAAISSSRRGSTSSSRDHRVETRRVALGVGDDDAAPASSSVARVARLMIARRARQRHEDRGQRRPRSSSATVPAPARHTATRGPSEQTRPCAPRTPRARSRGASPVARSVAERSRRTRRRCAARATWCTATSARRASGRSRPSVASLIVRAPSAPPNTATSGGSLRRRASSSRNSAPHRVAGQRRRRAASCPGSDTAARAPSRTPMRFASPGTASCSCTTAGPASSRAATTHGSDA